MPQDVDEAETRGCVGESDLWLKHLTRPPASPLERKLGEAIGCVTDELQRLPGPVEFIVTPAHCHSFAEVIVFRPLQDGVRGTLRVLSLDSFEQLVRSWSRRSADLSPSRSRRRRRAPVRLVFDRSELASLTTPWR